MLSWAAIGLALLIQAATAWSRPAVALVRAEAGAETLDAWHQDLQHSPVAERFGRSALASAAPGSVIVCDWEQATILWYLQRVEGLRPDVTIQYPIETLGETVARSAPERRTVYVSRTVPGLESYGVNTSVGPLVQVAPQPKGALPDRAAPVDVRFEGGLGIAGLAVPTDRIEQGSVLPVTVYWRADIPLDDDIAVSVRLVRSDGQVVAQQDERHPALGTSPTSRWPAGAIVGDYHELPVGSRLPPGDYRVRVVPYRVDPNVELNRLDADGRPAGPGAIVATVVVEPRQPRTPLDYLVRLTARP